MCFTHITRYYTVCCNMPATENTFLFGRKSLCRIDVNTDSNLFTRRFASQISSCLELFGEIVHNLKQNIRKIRVVVVNLSFSPRTFFYVSFRCVSRHLIYLNLFTITINLLCIFHAYLKCF